MEVDEVTRVGPAPSPMREPDSVDSVGLQRRDDGGWVWGGERWQHTGLSRAPRTAFARRGARVGKGRDHHFSVNLELANQTRADSKSSRRRLRSKEEVGYHQRLVKHC